jgi:hypothetical protein
MSKKELIDSIVHLLQTEFEPPYSVVSARDRSFLEQSTVAYLETKLSEFQQPSAPGRRPKPVSPEVQQIQAERTWDRFFFNHPEITDHAANRKLIFNYALSLSDDGVVTFQHLDEAAKLPSLDRQKPKQALTTSNLKQDEETLQEFCRGNQLASNTAALNLLRQEFGAGFTSVEISQALQSGLISLGPASQEELAARAQEYAEQRQDWLVNQASPAELREAANRESEQRRVAAAQQHLDQQLEAAVVRDSVMGFPSLPDTWNGRPLDAAFIKTCDVQTHKLLSKRFGSAALDLRLRGLK